jgi:hypothetical protein
MSEVTEKVRKVFKCTIPSCNFLMPNGKPIIFVLGKYITDIEDEIALLTKEVLGGHPHIYIDKNETEVQAPANSNELLAGLRKQIEEQVRAEMQQATNPANNMGTNAQEPVKPASTVDVAVAAAGGNGQQDVSTAKTISLDALRAKVADTPQAPAA